MRAPHDPRPRRHFLALAVVPLLGACAGAPGREAEAQPRARAVEVTTIPPAATGAASVASAAPEPEERAVATAPGPSASASGTVLPPLPPLPPAPPRQSADGAAAVLWASSASGGFGESVLVENAGGTATVVARRQERIFVSRSELWVLGSRPLSPVPCARCGGAPTPPDQVDVPVLRSLRTGKTLEPWSQHYQAYATCNPEVIQDEVGVYVEGAVGPYLLASVSGSTMWCTAPHAAYTDEPLVLDLDAGGAPVTLEFPPEVLEPLRARAHAELRDGCVIDRDESPREYRATAEYGARGELEGVYEYLMSAPYVCGLGPGHYSAVSAQRADWLPAALTPYGQLPAWVVGAMAAQKATTALLVAADRVAAAKAEFARK
ncbi:MAG: hypothetical protein HY908_28495 [Myxococcales bacterium]|nr:hypothetical protein [Myxococcales bacterium]